MPGMETFWERQFTIVGAHREFVVAVIRTGTYSYVTGHLRICRSARICLYVQAYVHMYTHMFGTYGVRTNGRRKECSYVHSYVRMADVGFFTSHAPYVFSLRQIRKWPVT